MLPNINFVIAIIIFVAGLYIMISSRNLIKKLFGMTIFQTAVLLFYISMAKITSSRIPILKCLNYKECPEIYSNPLPHILMLTAIVVGASTFAVGIAIIINIKERYHSIDEETIANQIEEENRT